MNFMQYWTSKIIKINTDKNLALKHFYANRTIFFKLKKSHKTIGEEKLLFNFSPLGSCELK